MKKFLVGLLLASGLIAEYRGQPGVIHYDANNYWNMDAGSLFTYKIHSDTIRSNRLESSKALVDSVEAGYIEGRYGEFEITKSGISSRPGGKGGVLTLRFDDGYRTNLDFFAPVLENYGVKAVIGIVSAIPCHVNSPSDTFMNWSEIRQLAHHYGWEVACHSYDHSSGPAREDYWVSWLNMVKAKEVIEDSVGIKVVSYIAPSGLVGGWDDYFLRREYLCCMMTEQGYNDFGNLDLYRLKIVQPPVDMQMIADSGYWAIRFFHAGSQAELEEAESLIVRAKRLGVQVLTPREVIEKYGLTNISPLRVSWDIETDGSFQWLATWKEVIDITTQDTAKFEVWNESGELLGWELAGQYDSITAETLKANAPSEANNLTIPTPTSLHIWMQVNDSITLSRYFSSSDSIAITYLSFYTIWRNANFPYGIFRWVLEDTVSRLFWRDSTKEWTSDTIYNPPPPYSYEPGCRRKGFYVYNLFPHTYRFTLHYKKTHSISEVYFDDLSVVPSATGNVEVRIIFDKVPSYSTQIQTEIDMLFDNGVGPILTSPGGYKYRLKVDDSGNLSTESVPR